MTTTITRETGVTRPTPTPLRSSVLDHATTQDVASFGLRNNEGLWPSYNCLDTLVPTPTCPDPLLSETGEFKQFTVAGWVPAFEFAVYGGVQCGAVGLDVNDQRSEIERVFRLNEGKGIERALRETRFLAGADWDAPVDISNPTMSLAGALAALEGYAAANYAGVPTIHLPRAAAVILFGLGLLTNNDGVFFTKTGAKVAAGGGYDDGSDNVPTGTYDLYVTGEVYVERSDEVSIQSYVLPGEGSGIGSGENGLSDNTVVALVERMYRVGVDCLVARATGRAWGSA